MGFLMSCLAVTTCPTDSHKLLVLSGFPSRNESKQWQIMIITGLMDYTDEYQFLICQSLICMFSQDTCKSSIKGFFSLATLAFRRRAYSMTLCRKALCMILHEDLKVGYLSILSASSLPSTLGLRKLLSVMVIFLTSFL